METKQETAFRERTVAVLAHRIHDARATALNAEREIGAQRRKRASLAYWKYVRSSREHEVNILWATAHQLEVIGEVRAETERLWGDHA